MEWVEVTGKTVEEAKDRALDELGIAADEAEFVVLEEPRRGLFGHVRGTARVRARVVPRTPRAKTDRRQRRGRGGGDRQEPKTGSSSDGTDTGAGPGRRNRNGKRSGGSSKQTPETAEAGGENRRRTERTKPHKEKNTMTMTLDQQVAATETFLSGLIDAMGYDARLVTTRADEANAHVNIEGENLGLLIGPRGQTMNAIQDLTRVALQKQAAGSWEGHVHVDVNGYRAKRREALVEFVRKVAADVSATGTAKALEPMSSADRKVVHDTVNAIDGVHTTSEGTEPRRWVKIVPGDA